MLLSVGFSQLLGCHPCESSSVPGWVFRTPVESGKLYAVGRVGRTLYPDDGKRNAADDARKELSKSLQAKVESIIVIIEQSDSRSYYNEAFVLQATSLATNVVTEKSQILEYWVDSEGLVPNAEQGTTYALAVLSLNDFPKQLGEKAKEYLPPTQAEDIEKRAEKAFRELDKQ